VEIKLITFPSHPLLQILIFKYVLLMCFSRVLSPFRGGEIVYLNDPDNYAGWNFYTTVRATQARQVEG